MTEPLLVAYVGGFEGPWRVEGITAPHGEPLAPAARLAVVEGPGAAEASGRWVLRGVVEGEGEIGQSPLGRPEARCAALLALRTAPAWRDLGGDERRKLGGGLAAPAVGHRRHRSLDPDEPYDTLHWFEFSPQEQGPFNELVDALRASDAWSYVERELDVRVIR